MTPMERVLNAAGPYGTASKERVTLVISYPEPDRRRVLRPHWEEGVAARESGFRLALDIALGRLLALELALTSGYLTEAEVRKQTEQEDAWKLNDSVATQRYLDDYDYFAVRHLRHNLEVRKKNEFCHDDLRVPGIAALDQEETEHIESFLEHAAHYTQVADVQTLFLLLDDFRIPDEVKLRDFRRWLEDEYDDVGFPAASLLRFNELATALTDWCRDTAAIYRRSHPHLQTRFAFFDFYWLTKLFCAEVSPVGKVESSSLTSWLDHVACKTGNNQLYSDKEVLQQAWSSACNWLQGTSLELNPPKPKGRVRLPWTQVFREELREIADYRHERNSNDRPPTEDRGSEADLLRVKRDLVGLAFSGGGIRSATFNLGVLEGLKEFDLLRRIDYLSTVSGGGYIGAWLVGNTIRGSGEPELNAKGEKQRFWLAKATDWRESIYFLRKYSNYLSPRVGFFSGDTWSIAAIWSRNTIVVQLLLFLSIFALLMAPHVFYLWFQSGTVPGLWWDLPLILGVVGICGNLLSLQPAAAGLRSWPSVSMACMFGAGCILAKKLWMLTLLTPGCAVCSVDSYRMVTETIFGALAGEPWLMMALVLSLSLCSIWWRVEGVFGRFLYGVAAAGLAWGGLHLALSGILWLFLQWRHTNPTSGVWYAIAFGPPLAVLAFDVVVILILGIAGSRSSEEKREWWSRLAAMLTIWIVLWLVASLGGLFAPLWLALAMQASQGWTITAVASWLATTVGGLFAAKSTDTGSAGAKSGQQIGKELLASLAPYIFAVGLIVGLSSVLHVVLLYAAGAWPPQGRYVDYYWAAFGSVGSGLTLAVFVILLMSAVIYSCVVDINIFSLSNFYKNRLVRCYLGATRSERDRDEQSFTGLDENDDLDLRLVRYKPGSTTVPYTGPFPLVNCSLNMGGSSDLSLHTRHSESFTFSPLHAGSARHAERFPPDVGYAHLTDGPTLGQAITISGAAASPNMGYHTSPVVAFLMTMFNVRLGWWYPKPGVPRKTPRSWLLLLAMEMFGSANKGGDFLHLSDGGHFENLGIYELVRRRCRVIIASDGECDPKLTLGSLGSVIRMCESDFGAVLPIDVSSITKIPGSDFSRSHAAVGRIHYDDGTEGWLIYLKSSLTGDEEAAVRQYKADHPDFPHETTADQFFSEDQFESYRTLGYTIAKQTFEVAHTGTFTEMAELLKDSLTPQLRNQDGFVDGAKALDGLWKDLSADPELHALGETLFDRANYAAAAPALNPSKAHYFCIRVIQLMENMYLDLHWESTWRHPDNSGWRKLAERCATSEMFRRAWVKSQKTYGIRFRRFCKDRLNLPDRM